MSLQYRLIRTLPNGEEKRQAVLNSLDLTVQDAAHALLAGGFATTEDEAKAFAERLRAAPLGETVRHTSAYSFRIDTK